MTCNNMNKLQQTFTNMPKCIFLYITTYLNYRDKYSLKLVCDKFNDWVTFTSKEINEKYWNDSKKIYIKISNCLNCLTCYVCEIKVCNKCYSCKKLHDPSTYENGLNKVNNGHGTTIPVCDGCIHTYYYY